MAENQPAQNSKQEEIMRESIAASTRIVEWMGVLQAGHAQYVEVAEDGSSTLMMDNAHTRRIENRLQPTQAVIRSSVSRLSLPSLELTIDQGNNVSEVTSVVQVSPTDQFYTTATTKRTVDSFGVTEAEEVYAPHPVTDLEVNGFLNEVAKLRPPRSMEKQPSPKKTGMSRFLGWLGLSSQRDK